MKINITYPISTSYTIQIERDNLPENPDDLIESVTRQEFNDCLLGNAYVPFDCIKDSWRFAKVCNLDIEDEDYNQLYPLTNDAKEECNWG